MEGDNEEMTKERETGRSMERKVGRSKEPEDDQIQQQTETIHRVHREKERLVESGKKWKKEQEEIHEMEDKRSREILERDLKRLEGEQERRERIEYEQCLAQEIEQSRKKEEEEYMRIHEKRVSSKEKFLEGLKQDLRDMRKDYKRETSRSVERKAGGSKMEEKAERKFNELDEKIKKNTDQFQQFMARMQEKDDKEAKEKQAREDKEAKEKEEKEQRRKQKEEKEQAREDKEAKEKKEKEQRRKQKEEKEQQEKRAREEKEAKDKQEMMQNFANLENRIKDSEVNFEEKIESMMKKNNEKLKEEMENKWVENKKQMEEKIDVQDRHFKESNKEMENRMNAQDNYLRGVAGQITQDKVEAKKNIGAIGNKIEGVERSIGTIEEKIKEVEFEQISQQEKIERVQQEIGTIRQGTSIENVRVMRPEVITQPPIYYGDYKVHPRKYITNMKIYLEENININREENRNKIMAIIRDTLKSDAEVWFTVMEEQCHNFEEFEKLFLKQFWGPQRQSKVRNSLIMGKYNKNIGRSNREKYALQKYSQAMYLEPKMMENEIISLIANHFDEDINMQIAIQDVRNLQIFLEYLRRIDQAEIQRAGTVRINHNQARQSPERGNEQRGYRRDQNSEGHYRRGNSPTYRVRRGNSGRFNSGRGHYQRYSRENMNRREDQGRVSESEENQQRERGEEQEI